jgi:pseudouridine synthase
LPEERLQKLISQAGITSRRASEELIKQGRVLVNGKTAKVGDKADLERDTVTVDGQKLKADVEYVYYLLNKPYNVLSSNKRIGNEKRKLVRELVPHQGHLFTVGRLDADSEGLILLTNDGELANHLMHPRYEHTKTYQVLVDGNPTEETLNIWRKGVTLDEKKAAPVKIKVLSKEPNETLLELVMREGRKRQIRRTALMLGHGVKRLVRVKIDMLEIGHLQPGQWRKLTPIEVRLLKQHAKPRK